MKDASRLQTQASHFQLPEELIASNDSLQKFSELKSLEVEPHGNLEWRISAVSARWLVAGREITVEDPTMTQSGVIAWKIRVAGLAFFGAIQICGCILGMMMSIFSGNMITLFFVVAHILAVILVLISTHVANRSTKVALVRTVDASALMLVGICLFGTTFLWPLQATFAGWHWSGGAILWQWASAMGPIMLLDKPIYTGISVFSIICILNAFLIVSCRRWVGTGGIEVQEQDTDTFAYAMVSGITTYAAVPAIAAVLFRRACQEYRWRLDAVQRQQQRLDAFRTSSRFLIFSLIPPTRAARLAHSSPALWHRGSQDAWENCTLVQMDVSGFTAMSSKIESEELVGLINALFTSVEHAAGCIGKIWLVELIGDCAKFIVGGPYPCHDNAYRAAVLAYSIVEVFKHVALRLGVALTVRVGVHTSAVVGAVVGSSMPRYLLHGRACEVLGSLEANAPRGGVLASEATAAALGDAWPHEQEHHFELADGTRSTGRLCGDAASIETHMRAARLAFPALDKLLSSFEGGQLLRCPSVRSETAPGERAASAVDGPGAAAGSGLADNADNAHASGDPPSEPAAETESDAAAETEALVVEKLVRRIRGFAQNTSGLVLKGGASLMEVARARSAVGVTTVSFGRSLSLAKKFAEACAKRSLSADDARLGGVGTPVSPSESKPAPWAASSPAALSAGTSIGEPRPPLDGGPRSQAVLEVAEEDASAGGGGGDDANRRRAARRQEAAAHRPPPAPSMPAARPASAESEQAGAPHGPSQLHALQWLPDGQLPTRLLAPASKAASTAVASLSFESGHSLPMSPLSPAPTSRGSQPARGSLQDLLTELVGHEEEELPAEATLDPEQLAVGRPEPALASQGQGGAMPLAFQRSLVLLFVAVLTPVTAAHTIFVAALHWTGQIDLYVWESSAVQQLVVVLPALLLALLLTAILVSKYSQLDWGSGRPQRVATMLGFVAPFALEGSVSGRSCNAEAILWAGAAVLIPCSMTVLPSSRWWRWMVGYWVVCFFLIGWEEEQIPGGAEPLSAAVTWGREVLVVLHLWAVGALMLAALGLAAKHVAQEQEHADALFRKTKKQALLEGKLLNALVPSELNERFLRGDTLIADHVQDGTVMFIYMSGYRETLLEYGTTATIRWINSVFEALDACISRRSSIIKVETFNDFLLVYSKAEGAHVDECISLAIDMLDAIRAVLRPCGAETAVKLGASSGNFTAGIIGSSTPRYSIFGDTVNTASRMASNSRPCTLSSFYMHLSGSTKAQVGEGLESWLKDNLALSTVERGQGMEIKGKGWMQTFCLCSPDSEERERATSHWRLGPGVDSEV